jgi:hypothetical protein
MAEKYSVLIKYKYLEYIESAKLSEADAWKLMRGIIKYDETEETPVFENPVLTGIFAVIKLDLDQNKENYEAVSQERSEAGKKGAQKRWGKRKNSKNNKSHENIEKIANAINDDKDSKCQENSKTMAKMHDLDHDYIYDSDLKREREEPLPHFSKSDELNPNRKNLVSRVEGRRKKWESCKLPPAPIITNLSVLNDLKDCLETYTDEKIDEAITNFAGVISQPGFDTSTLPGGQKPNFKNFLLRWVDRFIDEAKPFETFKPKHTTSAPVKGPDWGGSVDMGKGVKPKRFFGGGK